MPTICDTVEEIPSIADSVVVSSIRGAIIAVTMASAAIVIDSIYPPATVETAAASDSVVSDTINVTVTETAAATDLVVSNTFTGIRSTTEQIAAIDTVFNTLNKLFTETAAASDEVIDWRVLETSESISASDSVVSQNISITVLVTDTVGATDQAFLDGQEVYEAITASDSVTHWLTHQQPLITETAAATSAVVSEGVITHFVTTETASASSEVFDQVIARVLVTELAKVVDYAVQSWEGVTVWSADTYSFGMTRWDQYPVFDIQAAEGEWYGIVDGNIVQLVDEYTPQTDTLTAGTTALVEYSADAAEIDGAMVGTMVFGVAKQSGNTDWQYAQAKITAVNAGQNTQCALLLRMTTSASDVFSAFCLFLMEDGSLSISHIDVDGGAQTIDSLGELASTAADAYAVGDTVMFSVSGYGKGTDLVAWVNGQPVLEVDIGNSVADDFMLTGKQGYMFLDGADPVASTFEAGTLMDPSELVSGLTDFGDESLKRISCFRTSYRSADPLTVKIGNTGSGSEVEYSYPMIQRIAHDMVAGKAKLGKGARSRHWRVSVATSGKPFVMQDTLLETDNTSRKI